MNETGGYSEDYLVGAAKQLASTGPRAVPIRTRLEYEKGQLLERIANIDKMLALLTANPAIEEFQNLAGKGLF